MCGPVWLFLYLLSLKRGAKGTRGTVKLIDGKKTDNAMAKKENDKQTNNVSQDTSLQTP